VHCWQEANLPLLPGEGGLETHVQEPLGKAPRIVWAAARFYTVLCSMASYHIVHGTDNMASA